MTLKTIKGCDLALHLAQHVEASEEIDEQDNPLSTLFYIDSQILPVVEHTWYKDLVYYLKNKRFPNNLDTQKRRRLCLKSSRYVILGYFLFRRSDDGILIFCVNNEEAKKLLQETHGSLDFVIHVGGHVSAKTIAFKIIKKGYYWPSIFRDSYKFSRSCDKC
jgi:superfamily II DNA or RNA helicase